MMYGIDVSEHNGLINWNDIKDAGMQFAIIRCGYGLNEDTLFRENVYNANCTGLKCGAYHYGYALNPNQAFEEAKFVHDIITDSGCLLELPIFYDMEDTDGYKARRIDINKTNITEITETFINRLSLNYDVGLYASLDWLETLIEWQKIGCSVWSAQWSSVDLFKGYMWQYTDSLNIKGKYYDGDILYL